MSDVAGLHFLFQARHQCIPPAIDVKMAFHTLDVFMRISWGKGCQGGNCGTTWTYKWLTLTLQTSSLSVSYTNTSTIVPMVRNSSHLVSHKES